MANDKWLEHIPHTSITHLPSVGSDHCPILMEINARIENADQPSFLDTVKGCWNRSVEGDPMWNFHQKMKRVAATLSSWSRIQFGDIYAKVKDYEERSNIIDEEPLNCIPRMVNQAQNDELQALPTVEELKGVVFSMNPNSAAGLDGMNGCFFQKCWSIIKDDLIQLRGPQTNHLSVADDVIIFTSGRKKSLKLIMHSLGTYERVSGQLINKTKSHFMIPANSFRSTSDRIKRVTRFNQKEGPLIYLGCPIFIGRSRIIYFSEMINKVVNRITGWQTKMLSYGGKATLIKHVLQSLSIHILSAISPTSTIIKQIQGIMVDFFWGINKNKKKYHWSSWKNLSFPLDEGGI
ncbi:hypothetical protein H5410_031918 [Solanum commersonii]|uniref:Reverse transcriptase n=1 Tax=Solanum commersonii TaxID=4109 RepID=A0A9J5YN45_SOLCO|nr:hypothetical protein H5410_031918 [Solanum commersonii]